VGGLLSTVGWVGSSREKSWQDATHTVFWDKTELIMRIAVKLLLLVKTYY